MKDVAERVDKVVYTFKHDGEITMMTVYNYIAACDIAIKTINDSNIKNKKQMIREVKYMLGPTKQTPQVNYGRYMALMKLTGTAENKKQMIEWANKNNAPATGASAVLYGLIICCLDSIL